jgi:hypothetical protein
MMQWMKPNIVNVCVSNLNCFTRHNWGLEHAGENGDEYGDYSGFMSASMIPSHTYPKSPNECYNAYGHVIMGWFSDKTRYISDPATNGGLLKVAAFVDYTIAVAGVDDIIVQIGDSIFMQYNRARAHNSGTYAHGDRLVIVQASASEEASFVRAALAAGEVFDTPYTGRIEVCSRVDGSPDYLLVSVTGYGTGSVCNSGATVSTLSTVQETQAQLFDVGSSSASGIVPMSSFSYGGFGGTGSNGGLGGSTSSLGTYSMGLLNTVASYGT